MEMCPFTCFSVFDLHCPSTYYMLYVMDMLYITRASLFSLKHGEDRDTFKSDKVYWDCRGKPRWLTPLSLALFTNIHGCQFWGVGTCTQHFSSRLILCPPLNCSVIGEWGTSQCISNQTDADVHISFKKMIQNESWQEGCCNVVMFWTFSLGQ